MIDWNVAKKVRDGETAFRIFTDWGKFGDDYPDEKEELQKLWRGCVTRGEYKPHSHSFEGATVYAVEVVTENGGFTAVYHPEYNGMGLVNDDPLYVQWLMF
jgi:hypothetical protein